MKICPHCKKNIQENATVCPYCGKPVKASIITKIKTSAKYQIGLSLAVLALAAIITGGILFAQQNGIFAARQSCYEQSQAYLNAFTPLFSQWADTNQQIQGLSIDEIELAEISMEGIRDQIGALTPPKCAADAHALFMSYMDNTITGYNAFISKQPAATVQSYIDQASRDYENYHTLTLQIYPELSATSTPTP
jgi:hypothetical protein